MNGRKRLVALALAAALTSTRARAWGSDGHRVTGQLAWELLTPAARARVQALLAPGETLADAAAWADEVARDDPSLRWANKLHYIAVPATADAVVLDEQTCPTRGDHRQCIVAAIGEMAAQLMDPDAPDWKRQRALRFLVHFVGDLHQPLHVSHADGRGGNRVQVRFEGRHTSLHAVWDSGLVRPPPSPAPPEPDDDVTPWRWMDLADLLRRRGLSEAAASARSEVQRVDPGEWEAESTRLALRWAEESLVLSRRTALFGVEAGATLGAAYRAEAQPVVRTALTLASARLAALLNALLTPR